MAVKKTRLDHTRLPYPKITSLAAAGRVQRHVPDSIRTLRTRIAHDAAPSDFFNNPGNERIRAFIGKLGA